MRFDSAEFRVRMSRSVTPLLLAVALIAAWGLRWEKGPSHVDSSNMRTLYRDRWTGQAWLRVSIVSNSGWGYAFVPLKMLRIQASEQDAALRKAMGLSTSLTWAWGVAFALDSVVLIARFRSLLKELERSSSPKGAET